MGSVSRNQASKLIARSLSGALFQNPSTELALLANTCHRKCRRDRGNRIQLGGYWGYQKNLNYNPSLDLKEIRC